jgi:Zn-dependent M32 family carboxypeptidase
MNEQQIAEYCRKRRIYPEQIVQWQEACKNANDWEEEQQRKVKHSLKNHKKKIKFLEKELNRKDKALAEAAAKVWLKKKQSSCGERTRRINSTGR